MAAGKYGGSIGSVVGGIIGGIIGGVAYGNITAGIAIGSSIGGAGGAILGQVFWPEKVDLEHPVAPKPYENRVQLSSYGQPIPMVYQSARVAGNIIYMSNIVETFTDYKYRNDGQRMHDKTAQYTCTFAISYCEGPVIGLARIWINGEIFADYRDPAGPYYPSGNTELASVNLATSIARGTASYTVHLGTEDQVVDTALSALLTPAETPTYRGIFYIVFRDFPIGEFNAIPTFEVEIDTPMTTG